MQTDLNHDSDLDSPGGARAQIEETRERMSETIDAIEEQLLRRKEEIQERLDIFAPVRERPLPSVGAALGAGLLLGLLTGGGDKDEDRDSRGSRGFDAGDLAGGAAGFAALSDDAADDDEYFAQRAGMWEARARRLLDVAETRDRQLDELHEELRQLRQQFAAGGIGAAGMSGSFNTSSHGGSGLTGGGGMQRPRFDHYDAAGSLGASGLGHPGYAGEFYEDDEDEGFRNGLDELRETVAGGIGGFIQRAVAGLRGRRAETDLDATY